MLATAGYVLSVILGLFLFFIGIRALLAPRPAAEGFGVPVPRNGVEPFMAIKGGRDISLGLILFALLLAATPQALAWYLVGAAVIPLIDGVIVLRSGGPKMTAYAVHWGTAVIVLGTAGLLAA